MRWVMKTHRTLSDFLKSILDSRPNPSETSSGKYYSISFLSYYFDYFGHYFCWQIKQHSQKIICMKTKMKLLASLKIWVVIYPSITLFLYLFGEPLSVLPLYQRTFLLTVSLVPWIVFAGVPFVDAMIRLFSIKNENQ
jgi:hypothetical protein